MTRRNTPSAPALWRFWDSVEIALHEMIGYWETDPAVTLSVMPPVPTPPPTLPPNISACLAPSGWKLTVGSYVNGDGGAAGAIGFGSSCGPSRPFDYPPMTVAEIKKKCCELGDGCWAFSWLASQNTQMPGVACAKKNEGGGVTHGSTYNGYEKTAPYTPQPPTPGPAASCDATLVKATTFVKHGVSAVVVVASWCPGASLVLLAYDLDLIGLTKGKIKVTQPAIAGVQTAAEHGDGSAPILIAGGSNTNSGVILVVTAN